jgi:NAD(P)-dependent dehydrogenase (short-subunit alcohol dehydrogenase family)
MGVLDGKVALVTGSSRGIGKAIALGLAEHGADIVVTARGRQPASPFTGTAVQTATEIEAIGRRAIALEVDLADRGRVEALAASALDTFGRVDILVNNAAATDEVVFADFWTTDLAAWDRQLAVNVTAPYILCRALVPGMRDRGWGVIVNVTSEAAIFLEPEEMERDPTGLVYGPSKAMLTKFSAMLARDLRPHGICVVPLDPGYTLSESAELHLGEDALPHQRIEFTHPVSLPAGAVVRIATADDPMRWSGHYIPWTELAAV